MKSNLVSGEYALVGLSAVLLVVVTLNSVLLNNVSTVISLKQDAFEELQKPPEISVALLLALPDCSNCFDAHPAVEKLGASANAKINLRELNFGSEESQSLIKKYGIRKLPSFIVSGELNKSAALRNSLNEVAAETADGNFLFDKQEPPYYDVKKKRVVGLVNLTIIDYGGCGDCFNASLVIEGLKRLGAVVVSEKTLDSNGEEASELIKRYGITLLPTLVASPDLSEYPKVREAWQGAGSVEKDGFLVWRQVSPPYYDVALQRVRGRVDLINLIDASCAECYNVSLHKRVLERVGLVFANETTFDVNSSEGMRFISEYNITAAPTVLLSSEASVYPVIQQIWTQVGTIEADGTLVFRNMSELTGSAAYKDLISGQVVNQTS